MKVQWNKVTWYSKTIALAIFIVWPFIFFCLGMLYGSAKQYERDALAALQKVFVAPSLTATKVIDYVPSAPAENANLVDGSCWTNSIAAPFRGDAWRCTVGNNIHDPCFQIPGNANLLCDPNFGNIADTSPVILSLVKPLPKPGKIPAPRSPADGAWLIKIKGGILCSPFTGTLPFSDKGDVATYGCSDKRLIFGINADKKIWTAKVGSLDAATKSFPPPLINLATVPIAVVWK